ncbi:ABC transporter, ATP-binding protein [Candidatus Pelagibacter sp. IMCC9063]|uniref:ABC transporter ATP-binding protein n=1 Tax=Pelagibacter sp. (strain IMCC9063) TaxID=1002672 RepID=UPI00020466BA|nr:ABC transporter ATP-binding protein [Candidatus Pelagibacter sp. IMCC9063]AEA80786.1 ABC transporter, ATP-binding protein [Candidatus Pelagibacter sp. IMCC9063]
MNNSIALEIKNVGKTYKLQDGNSLKALDDITFNVKQGEIFGLLGPNGAGKSTLINILGGTVIKSNGLVNVWGFDLDLNPRQVRASIGIVPQEINVDPFFTPKKLLDIQAGMYGVAKKDRITDKILELTSLTDKADSYMRSLSGGMKRRLLLAKAMVHQPPILILDEPTAGVDVDLRQKLLENVKELNKQGVTIILTTHYLQEAEELCDRIAIINHGKIVALDKTENLLAEIHLKKIKFKVKNFKNIGDKLDDHLKIKYLKNNQISVKYDKTISNIENIIFKIKEKGLEIEDIMTEDADLEDVFIKLTKNL